MSPDFGERLYQLLPAVYRTRDDGDLHAFLAACGELLDQVHATLEQRLADAFPDPPARGRACQDWLLPYFADLLDLRLVSPESAGRRAELANAVAWRQASGTLATVESIAEAVGQLEVEVHEGWRRVATTPRIGMPLVPARALGYASEPFAGAPSLAARHPGLPAVTVDFRCPSRAVLAAAGAPGTRSTRFDGHVRTWRQSSVHGAPCFPGSYEDVSRRTVDLRTPTWRQGLYHPRRLLLHVTPPAGFFPAITPALRLRVAGWNQPGATVTYGPCTHDAHDGYCMDFALAAPAAVSAGHRAMLLVEQGSEVRGLPVVVTRVTDESLHLLGPEPPPGLALPVAGDKVELVLSELVRFAWSERSQPRHAELFAETVEAGKVRAFRNKTLGTPWFVPIHISGVIELGVEPGDEPGDESYSFTGLVLEHTVIVHRNQVTLSDCAARKVEVHAIDTERPVLRARSCLFEAVQAARGLSRLEHCTVLGETSSEALQASDCIFLGLLRRHQLSPLPPARGCLRYSRIRPDQATGSLSVFRSTREPVVMFATGFGTRGCGVLHPDAPESLRFGAEDGGELGAYHSRAYSLRSAAVLEKLRDHLPMGQVAVVVPDARLLAVPHG